MFNGIIYESVVYKYQKISLLRFVQIKFVVTKYCCVSSDLVLQLLHIRIYRSIKYCCVSSDLVLQLLHIRIYRSTKYELTAGNYCSFTQVQRNGKAVPNCKSFTSRYDVIFQEKKINLHATPMTEPQTHHCYIWIFSL